MIKQEVMERDLISVVRREDTLVISAWELGDVIYGNKEINQQKNHKKDG